MSAILTVSELTRRVKDSLEAEFPFVWVKGQVSNLARPSSGHIYFTLKDRDAALSVVWFRNRQFGLGQTGLAQTGLAPIVLDGSGEAAGPDHGPQVHPLTGEVLEGPLPPLADGVECLCAGRLTVYPPRGSYQLAAELVQPQGAGDLHLAFEALKRELAERGWFDLSRKRPLPVNPVRVAVVTAATGAAVHDFIRVASTRGRGCEIRVFPTPVQGEAAPASIAAALEAAGSAVQGNGRSRSGGGRWAEAVALIRGGGSLEDLWAFNTEPVARAVVECPVPVVCGVGHEVDVTIADLAADQRAATPSHAAQLLWTERRELAQAADGLEMDLRRAFGDFLDDRGAALGHLVRALGLVSPRRRLEGLRERFWYAVSGLARAGEAFVRRKAGTLDRLAAGLDTDFGLARLQARQAELAALAGRLRLAGLAHLESRQASFETLRAGFLPLDPQAPLERGYGLVRVRRSGRFLRDPAEVSPGDALDITVARGRVAAVVAGQEADPKGAGRE